MTSPVPSSIENTGFFSSDNIKTLLLSGAALFVLSAYLFVRSYWDFIPAFIKFMALVLMAVSVYGTGWFLWNKRNTPKTAETLLNGYAHGAQFSGDPTVDNGFIRAQKRQFNPARDYLWAIPSGDLELDKNLTQNPGY